MFMKGPSCTFAKNFDFVLNICLSVAEVVFKVVRILTYVIV